MKIILIFLTFIATTFSIEAADLAAMLAKRQLAIEPSAQDNSASEEEKKPDFKFLFKPKIVPSAAPSGNSTSAKPLWKIKQEEAAALKLEDEQIKKEEFESKPTKAKIELGILTEYESIKRVQDIIKESGLAADEILVVFDFDQTLTGRKIKEDGKLIEDGKDVFHGSVTNNTIINWLYNKGIAWGILSARSRTKTSVEAVEQKMKDFGIKSKLKKPFKVERRTTFYRGKLQDVDYGLWNEKAYAAEPGDEYAFYKDIGLDYLIENYATEFNGGYPKLIIFVDDSAVNIQTIHDCFTKDFGRTHDTKVYALLYEQPDKTEPGHQEAFTELEPFLKKSILLKSLDNTQELWGRIPTRKKFEWPARQIQRDIEAIRLKLNNTRVALVERDAEYIKLQITSLNEQLAALLAG